MQAKEVRCLLKYNVPTRCKKDRKPIFLFSGVKSDSDPSWLLAPEMNLQCIKKVFRTVAFPKFLK